MSASPVSAQVGILVNGEEIVRQEVDGTPQTVEVVVELPTASLTGFAGEVVFVPFAVDARGAESDGTTQDGACTVTFNRPVVDLSYTPLHEGQHVQVFASGRAARQQLGTSVKDLRTGSRLVTIGLQVQRDSQGNTRIVSTDAARVQVVYADGQTGDPQHYQVLFGHIRVERLADGQMVLQPRGYWDAPTRTWTRWLRRYGRVGLGPPTVGIYTAPTGEQRIDYLFPYVEAVQPAAKAAKPVVMDAEGRIELEEMMAALVAELPPPEALLAAGSRGEAEDIPAWEGDSVASPVRPGDTILWPNFPNPFNPSTQLVFRLTQGGQVRLVIYDLLGHRVVTLMEGVRAAGVHRVEWDGRDAAGVPVGSGRYFCRLEAGAFQAVEKLLLVR